MSLAIKFGDSSDTSSLSGVIYFNAVLQYDKSLTGKVTEHPIEAGSHVSDHYISQNPKYKLNGVISSVDFSIIPSLLSVDGEFPMNVNPVPSEVTINDIGSGLSRFIPDTVGQFLGFTTPNVIIDQSERKNYKTDVEFFMKDLMTGLYWNQDRGKWENKMTLCTLFDIDGITAINPITDLVVTSFNVKEDADSWSDLYFDISLEQVQFVTLEQAEAPKTAPKSKESRATEPTKNGGNEPGNTSKIDEEKETFIGAVKSGNEEIAKAFN